MFDCINFCLFTFHVSTFLALSPLLSHSPYSRTILSIDSSISLSHLEVGSKILVFVVEFRLCRVLCIHLALTASTLKKSLVYMMAHSTWHIEFTSRTTIFFVLIYLVTAIFWLENVSAQIEKQPWYESLPAVAMDYKVHLPAGKEDCYYQYVQQGATLYVSFQVNPISNRLSFILPPIINSSNGCCMSFMNVCVFMPLFG